MARPLIIQDEALSGGLQRDAAGDRKFQSFRQLENVDIIFDPVVSLRRRQAFGSFTDVTFPYNLKQVYVTVLKGAEVVFLVDVQGNIHRLLGNHEPENVVSPAYFGHAYLGANFVQVTVNSTNGLKYGEKVVIAGSTESSYNGTFLSYITQNSIPAYNVAHTHLANSFMILPAGNTGFVAGTEDAGGTWYRDTIIYDMKATNPVTPVGDLPDQVHFETVDDRVYFSTHTKNGEQGYYVVGTERATNRATDDWSNTYFPVPVSMPSLPLSYTDLSSTVYPEIKTNTYNISAVMPWRPATAGGNLSTVIRKNISALVASPALTATSSKLAQYITAPFFCGAGAISEAGAEVMAQSVELLLYRTGSTFGKIRVVLCPTLSGSAGTPDVDSSDAITSEWLSTMAVVKNDELARHPNYNVANQHTSTFSHYPYLVTHFTFNEQFVFDTSIHSWIVLEADDDYIASLSGAGSEVNWHQAQNVVAQSATGWYIGAYSDPSYWPRYLNNTAWSPIDPGGTWQDLAGDHNYTFWFEIGASLYGDVATDGSSIKYAITPYSTFEKSEGDLATDKQYASWQPSTFAQTIAAGQGPYIETNTIPVLRLRDDDEGVPTNEEFQLLDGRLNALSVYRTAASVSEVVPSGISNVNKWLATTDYRFVGRSGKVAYIQSTIADAMDNGIVSASTTGKDPLIRSLVDADDNPIAPTAIKHWQDRLWIVTGNKIRWSDRIEDLSPLGITGDPNYYSYNITNEWDLKKPVTGLSVYNDRLMVTLGNQLYSFSGGMSVLNPPPDLMLTEVTTSEGVSNSNSIVEAGGMLMFVNQFGNLKAFTGQERTTDVSEANQSLWKGFKRWKSVLHQDQLYVAVSSSASLDYYEEIHILDLSRRQPYWRVYKVTSVNITDLAVTNDNRLIATYYVTSPASTGILSFNGHETSTETAITTAIETHPAVNPNGDRSRWTGFNIKGKYPDTPPSMVVTATGEEGKTSTKTITPVNTADIRNESGGLRLLSETCRLHITSTATTQDEIRYIELK